MSLHDHKPRGEYGQSNDLRGVHSANMLGRSGGKAYDVVVLTASCLMDAFIGDREVHASTAKRQGPKAAKLTCNNH